MIKVIAVRANDDFSLDLEFNDGSVKRFDATPYLDYEAFRELKVLGYFKQVTVAFGTVQWPHEQDISPRPCIWRALSCLSPLLVIRLCCLRDGAAVSSEEQNSQANIAEHD